jgi:predicted RNA binding protein YcfA (HicA-like mRNA interferase family)
LSSVLKNNLKNLIKFKIKDKLYKVITKRKFHLPVIFPTLEVSALGTLPCLSFNELSKVLTKDGFQKVRQKGGHVRYQKKTPEQTWSVTVPNHGTLKKGTLIAIINQAGFTKSDFLDILNNS